MSYKLDSDAVEWQDDIQIYRKLQGKDTIHCQYRMKKVLIDLWFPRDYYDMLHYDGEETSIARP